MEKQRWEESEKRKEETRSEKRKSQKKEDAGTGKGRKVAPHCVLSDPKLTPRYAKAGPTWCNLGPFGGSFAPSWAQRRHNMGNIAQHEASSMLRTRWTSKHMGFQADFAAAELLPNRSKLGMGWGHVSQN